MHPTLSLPPELLIALEALDSARMLEHTRTLCALGRRVGTPGHACASAFLTEQLHQRGWDVRTHSFPLTTPVLDLLAPLTLVQCTPDGEPLRVFAHRTEFCEHPRSASHPEVMEGDVVSFSEEGDYEGAWVHLETVPQGPRHAQ